MKGKERCIWILVILFAVIFLFSFTVGRLEVPGMQVCRILTDRFTPLNLEMTWTDAMETAVLKVRLPRILVASLVGCCLASAGAAYQGVFQNPMASPDLLGASSAACFGAALAIMLGMAKSWVTIFAFACSLGSVMMVQTISRKIRGSQNSRVVSIILAGMMISSLFTAGTSWLKLAADPFEQLPAITYWLMGSLSGVRMGDMLFALIPAAIGLVILLLLRWKMNLLAMGDEEAMTMGISTSRVRVLVMIASTLLTAASVSVSGMIGWVGLVVPHLCRRMTGNDYRYLLPASAVFGAVFLLMVDNMARTMTETEFPIGILTAFIGAPFFLYLMLGKGGRV